MAKTLIVRPAGLGDILLIGMTISSIKKKYEEDEFDLVVLEGYEEVAKLFLGINKVYTVPQFYYNGSPDGELFKRHQREFRDQYDHILNWQDEAIEVFGNKNQIPRTELFLANSPYEDVVVNISDAQAKLKMFSKTKTSYNPSGKKNIGVCMTSVSFYRSFDEEKIVKSVTALLDTGHAVTHFGFRKLSEKIKHKDFMDLGSSLKPLELIQMVSGLDFLVTVDTAAFHMVTLLEVPYLAFFGEVNSKLRTSHLNRINGEIVCNNDLDCVSGECLFCNERPCLNDYDEKFIVEKVNEII